MYLFDASAIINLIKKGKAKIFAYGVTLDLALYESLNAIWKEFNLLKRIDKETAVEYIDALLMAFKAMKKVSIEDSEMEIFELAYNENITVYDASYLYSAIKYNLILITDDRKLMNVASKYVKTMNSNDIIKICSIRSMKY